MSEKYPWYAKPVLLESEIEGSYRRVSDKVGFSTSLSNICLYYKDHETGNVAFGKEFGRLSSSTDNLVMYADSDQQDTDADLFCVVFSSNDAVDANGDPLPIGIYVGENYTHSESGTDADRLFGLSGYSSVTDPNDLINVWIPVVRDDPVYKFLRDQSKSSVAAGTVITRRSLTSEKLYRIGYANRTTTQKDVEIPTLELVVHETKTGDVYALDKTATDIYKAYTNQHTVTLIGFDLVEYTLSSVVVNDPSISFTFAPVSGSHDALTFTASSSDPYPSRSGGGGK